MKMKHSPTHQPINENSGFWSSFHKVELFSKAKSSSILFVRQIVVESLGLFIPLEIIMKIVFNYQFYLLYLDNFLRTNLFYNLNTLGIRQIKFLPNLKILLIRQIKFRQFRQNIFPSKFLPLR